jgi:hypothetical protein
MLLIKTVITSIFLVFYFIDLTRLPEKWKINFKPFNCNLCLSFYVAIILYSVPVWVLNYILVASISGVIAPLFRNLMVNIFFKKS